MIREEAIEILQGAIKKPNTKDGYLGQAIDMAIKALEQEPFINKPCVSSGVCEHDKNKVLDKIRAKIEKLRPNLRPEQMTDYDYAMVEVVDDIVAILDNYKADKEEE